jgi:hypothetical protein
MKLQPFTNSDHSVEGLSFYCPACDHLHAFYTKHAFNGVVKETWNFDGNLDKPSFTPSLKNTCDNHPDPKQRCCHLTVTNGKIKYHDDCSHLMAGRTIDLPDRWPSGWTGAASEGAK